MPGGLPTEALIAQVIVTTPGDHLPFCREADIHTREGINLDRATLGNRVGRACFHPRPIIDRMRWHLKGADRVFMDGSQGLWLLRERALREPGSFDSSNRAGARVIPGPRGAG